MHSTATKSSQSSDRDSRVPPSTVGPPPNDSESRQESRQADLGHYSDLSEEVLIRNTSAASRTKAEFTLRILGKKLYRLIGTATSTLRPLPEFLLIGGKRCGSTSLYQTLVSHPNVLPLFPSKRLAPMRDNYKGVHYFDAHHERSVRWYRGHFPTVVSRRWTALTRGGVAIAGEGSPYYLFHPEAAERAARVVPEAQIIVVLRDPVDRAWSHYREQRRRGNEPEPSFARALELEDVRLAQGVEDVQGRWRSPGFCHEHLTYKKQGEYLDSLENWFAHFPEEQINVLVAEEFFSDFTKTFDGLTRVLGLPDAKVESVMKNIAPKKAMPRDVEADLTRQYEESNRRLEARLGKSLPWRKV